MTPQIALDLSLDGIAVLSRADGGVWWREGHVRLDDPDMAGALTRLRARCAARVGEGFTSILIIPDSQILFTSLERDDRDPKVTIRTLLEGRTPYEVADLAFDYIQKGDRLQVAVVAIETLLEAEEFAAGFGYQPVALMANPSDSTYPGQAHFGQTGLATEILAGAKLALETDDGFDVVPAPNAPEMPEPEPEPEPEETAAPAADKAEPEAVPAPEPADETPAADENEARLPPSPPAPIAPVTPPVAAEPIPETKPAPAAGTFEEALAAVDATPSAPTPEAPKAPQPPEVASPDTEAPRLPEAPAAPTAPVAAEPAFSTRRKAGGPVPDTTTEDPSLKRITPRLSAPAKGDAAKPAATPPEEEAAAPEVVPPVAAAAVKSRLPNLGFNRTKGTKTPDAHDPEAVALALPGLAREEAVKPRRGGGAKLGLYLTLSLIGLMALVALWSVLQSPDRDVAGDAVVAPAGGDTALLIPEVTAPPAPAAEDLARLLPTSDTTAPEVATSSGPVAPPLPITDAARPAEVETPESEADAETLDPEGSFDDSPASPPAPAPGSAETVIAAVDPARVDGDTEALPPAALPDTTPLAPAPATPTPAPADDAAAPPPVVVTEVPEETETPEVAPVADVPEDTETPNAPDTEIATQEPDAPLVAASAEGTLAPGGYTVFAGRPDILPVQRASTVEALPDAAETAAPTPEEEAARAALRRTPPVQRPATQTAVAPSDSAEDAPPIAEGFTREELTRTRPSQRPEAITDAAAAAAREAEAARQAAAEERAAAVDAAAAAAVASLASQAAQAAAQQAAAEQAAPPTSALALAASDRPRGRPRSVERAAARIVTQRREQASAAAASTAQPQATPAPAAPASNQTIRSAGGSVARAATQQNAIRLRDINLIGVYGRPNARRAIVRLSNGRYVKVEVGDRLNRGRVTAIGDSQLVYQRGGRNVTLRMPNA